MQSHNESKAMSLLHQTISVDSLGQVAARIWNESNPYQSLWPKKFEVVFDLPIPAEVNDVLWGNKLGGGGLAVDDLQNSMEDTSAEYSQHPHGHADYYVENGNEPETLADGSSDSDSINTDPELRGIKEDIDEPINVRAELPDLEIGEDIPLANRLTCLHRWKRVKKPRA